MQQCEANPQCSAVEWYEAKWNGSSCFHMNQGFGKNRAVRGGSGPQWRDAECLVVETISERYSKSNNYCVNAEGEDIV